MTGHVAELIPQTGNNTPALLVQRGQQGPCRLNHPLTTAISNPRPSTLISSARRMQSTHVDNAYVSTSYPDDDVPDERAGSPERSSSNDNAADVDALVLDEDFIRGGRREATAEERLAQARRIARANDQLRAAGEIADGTGKPGRRPRRSWLVWTAAGVAIGVIVITVLVSRAG